MRRRGIWGIVVGLAAVAAGFGLRHGGASPESGPAAPDVPVAASPPRLAAAEPPRAAATPAPRAKALTGRLVRGDGEPAGVATVEDFSGSRERPIASVDADPAGRFEFDEAPAGAHVLLARTQSGAVGLLPVTLVPGTPTDVVVRVVPASAVAGRVVARDGTPVAHAHVEASPSLEGLPTGLASALAASAESGDDGTLRLAPLLPGPHALTARAAGFVSAPATTVVAPATDVRLVLTPAGAIEVVVVLVGSARPDAVTVGLDADRTQRFPVGGEESARLDLVPVGAHEVFADAPGFTRAAARVEVVAAAKPVSVRLTLTPAVAVTGRVVAREGGAPVAGAAVRLSSIEGPASASTMRLEQTLSTDDGGVWRARLRPGTWGFEVRKAGFVQGETSGAVRSETTAPLGARFDVHEEPVDLETFLLPAPAIVGTVLDATGHPVANASVVVASAGATPDSSPNTVVMVTADMQATSAADGTFRIEGMTAGARYDLRAEAPEGEGTAEGVVFRAGEVVAHAEIRLEKTPRAGASLRGRVVDEAGKPVAGAGVWLLREIRQPSVVGSDDAGRVSTAADGTFRARALKAGGYRAQLTATGFTETYTPLLEVAENEDAHASDWVIASHGLAIRGRCVDVEGRPVADLKVCAAFRLWTVHGGIYAGCVTTDSDGRYEMRTPAGPPCIVDVHTKSPVFVSENALARAEPEAVVDFHMRRTGTLRGRIAFKGPVPQKVTARYRCEVKYASPRLFVTWYDGVVTKEADGEYRVEGLWPGPRAVFFAAEGYAPTVPVPIDLADGGSGEWKPVEMTRGGAIAGRVSLAGKPTKDVRVGIFDTWFVYADSLGDGRFRLDHLPAGTWRFEAERGTGNRDDDRTFDATIAEGKTTEVEWDLSPGGPAPK